MRSSGTPAVSTLVLANRLPFPLEDGWNTRAFHVVRSVAALGRATFLVFDASSPAVRDAAREAYGPNVELIFVPPPPSPKVLRYLRGVATRWPLPVWNQESPDMAREIVRQLAARPFHACLAVTTFFERYRPLLPAGLPFAIDTHNIDSLNFARYAVTEHSAARRFYARVTATKLERLERESFSSADLVWVCSDDEVTTARRLAPRANVRVAPNGVDLDHVAAPASPVTDRMLFFGRLDYYPNVDGLRWFVREVLPRIVAARPGATLRVVGAGDRAQADAIAREHPAVEMVGRVERVADELARAATVVVPLRVGGGTRLKILEALGAARPTVSTSIGAEGLDLPPERAIILADGVEAFASQTAALLADPARAEALGQRGRESVRERYAWTTIGAGLQADLRAVLERRA